VTTPESPLDPTLLPAALRAADLEALARDFGTPLFVYDEAHLRARCREYLDAFGAGNVAYAGKAFLSGAMVRLVAEEGLHLDVATGGELYVALHAGFPPARLVMHGNNKSEAEIERARDAGVGRIVADSSDEIDRLERLGFGGEVLVRVTPGVEAHTHEFIQTGTDDSKFGFTVSTGAAADAVARVAASTALRFGGIHAHIGSQVFRMDSYAEAAGVVARFADECERTTGVGIPVVNLGGGLGARYVAADPDPSVTEYAAALRTGIGERRVMVEPGRSIAAVAGITIYRVGTVKRIPGGRTYVAVDGGMSDNPRPVLYGAGYEAYLPREPGAERTLRCTVAGKHCEQGDVIVADARLPDDVAVGDLLVTPVTGAYGYSMASNYNKVPRPAVVFVRDGDARVVVRRETDADLVRLDA
jgi:diaminopimelate decarboxylase